ARGDGHIRVDGRQWIEEARRGQVLLRSSLRVRPRRVAAAAPGGGECDRPAEARADHEDVPEVAPTAFGRPPPAGAPCRTRTDRGCTSPRRGAGKACSRPPPGSPPRSPRARPSLP